MKKYILRGKNHPMYGKKHSPETIAKMSASHKKQIISPETREKMRQTMLGKKPKNLDWLHSFNKGEKHGNWKGDNVKHAALHSWVYRWKEKATHCLHCKATSEEKRLTWANIDHKYRRNLDDFIPLCYKCHQAYDVKYNNWRIKSRFKEGQKVSPETRKKISETMRRIRSNKESS